MGWALSVGSARILAVARHSTITRCRLVWTSSSTHVAGGVHEVDDELAHLLGRQMSSPREDLGEGEEDRAHPRHW
ncbi:hypothetical protein AMK13_09345 [Streptomyces sp. CB02056]|nr:hypothetical protein AMK13_09345 [Streptomyces sp. CB02056]